MKLVVGLGNPGQEYSATRHNVGFMVVDELARKWETNGNWRKKESALVMECRGQEPILLIKPQTYMNLSGVAVGALARWYKVSTTDIIVVYDDLDLPVGKLRLRLKGGSGGHRGMESLLAHLPQNDFNRVRIGIGRPPTGWEVADYVLSRFTAEDAPLLADVVERAALAIQAIIKEGMNKAMNQYNQ